MIENSLIYTFFRCVNLGVVIFLFAHVYRISIRHILCDGIAKEKNQDTQLEESLANLEQTNQKTLIQFEAQKQESIILLEKVHLWHTSVTAYNSVIQEQLQSQIARLHKRAQIQYENDCQQQYQDRMVPLALAQAKNLFEQKYTHSVHANEFLKNLIHHVGQIKQTCRYE